MAYTQSLKKLIKEFENLPGIGSKTAERLGFHILNVSKEEALALADAITRVKEQIRYCKRCFNISDHEFCNICLSPKRNPRLICVVEQIKDLIALEKTGTFPGCYHVLQGRIAPLDNKHPEDTTIAQLIARVKENYQTQNAIEEIILATNPNIEGDTTALYVKDLLKEYPEIKISRIARGLPSGGSIEFANQAMLTDALSGRQAIK